MLRTSPIKLAENLSPSVNIVQNVKVSSGGGYNNETIGRSIPYKKPIIRATGYPIYNTNTIFTQLRKTFIKALIFCHFNLECHIRIKTNTFNYAICEVIN